MAAEPDILVVAALAEELGDFVDRIGGRRVRHAGPGRLYHGRRGERAVAAAILGDGARRARAGLEGLMARHRPRRALLLGVAGALSPDLEVGAPVRIVDVAETGEGSPGWVVRSGSEGGGTALSTSRVVTGVAEKSALWRQLGEPPRAVVDLESAAFVRVMLESGIAWTLIRAVSDAADEDLPVELAAASDADGHVRRVRLLAALARRPWRLRSLVTLRRRVGLCRELLATAGVEWVTGEAEERSGGAGRASPAEAPENGSR